MAAINDLPIRADLDNDDELLGYEGPSGRVYRNTGQPFRLKVSTLLTTVAGAGSAAGGHTFTIATSTAHATIKARCDILLSGTADDVTINTYLALGSVVISDGDVFVNAPILVQKPGTSFRGSGLGISQTTGGRGFGTCIYQTAGFAGAAAVIVSMEPSPVYPAGSVTLRDFVINGSPAKTAGNTTAHGLEVKSFQFLVENVHVLFAPVAGFYVHGFSTGEISGGFDTYDGKFDNCLARNCGQYGMWRGNNSNDLVIDNCTFATNGDFTGLTGAGMYVSSGAGTQISNCHFYGNYYNLQYVAGGSRDHISNCKFQHSKADGVWFDGSSAGCSSVQFDNCDFNSNNSLSTVGASHVRCSGTFAFPGLQFSNCKWGNSDSAAYTCAYAINMGNVATSTQVIGCDFGSDSGAVASAQCATGLINFGTNVRSGFMAIGNRGYPDLRGDGAAIAPTAGAAQGTSPPAMTTNTATGTRGVVNFGSGTSPTTGKLFKVNFPFTHEQVGDIPMVTPGNAATQALGLYVPFSGVTSTGFDVHCVVAPGASAAAGTYQVLYHCKG